MGIPRVMGDATLLPNGDVILLNGGQVSEAASESHKFVPFMLGSKAISVVLVLLILSTVPCQQCVILASAFIIVMSPPSPPPPPPPTHTHTVASFGPCAIDPHHHTYILLCDVPPHPPPHTHVPTLTRAFLLAEGRRRRRRDRRRRARQQPCLLGPALPARPPLRPEVHHPGCVPDRSPLPQCRVPDHQWHSVRDGVRPMCQGREPGQLLPASTRQGVYVWPGV
jgi:hypothetical protein